MYLNEIIWYVTRSFSIIDIKYCPQPIPAFYAMIAIHGNTPIFSRDVSIIQESLPARPRIATTPSVRKQLLDLAVACLVLLFILSWLIPVIALLIKMESRGPVFFKQLRTGKNGKPFYCFKFRSMYVNEESDTHQARRNDARVTKVGAFMRKTSLDELPQFLNVLKMEMSVVGPRPHMIRHTEDYAKTVDNFMDRHLVKPGITGLAQVSGHRGEINSTEAIAKRVHLDICYLHNWSFQLDVKIIVLTFVQMIKGSDNAF